MRRIPLLLAVLLQLAVPALPTAAQNSAHDVNITVTLATDGSARVREVWDMTLSRGTEVYLGRENLGDIKILDLTVSDETGTTYQTDRSWDTERSFERKKDRCGLNSIANGYEICWGIGEYGHRTYTVDYTLTNLVKSLDDYDMIHYMFYTPNDFRAEHVKVVLEKPGFVMDTLTRIWAFGYDGYIWREDGKVIAESENPLEAQHDIIILMRFDKGTFESKSVQERPFQVVLDRALEGADKPDNPLPKWKEVLYAILGAILFFGMLLLPFLPMIIRILQKRKTRKDTFGTTRLRDIGWSRELPYGGDILKNYYVISTAPGLNVKKNSVASAMILRMLQEGSLAAVRDLGTGKVDIHLKPDKRDLTQQNEQESKLWDMMYEASGENRVLEEKEFSKWARSHNSTLIKWTTSVQSGGLDGLRSGGYYQRGKYTDAGRRENCKILGFKKFLEDATLIKQRTTPEVTLWKEYLIMASLFGIADKVAKELKDIDPVVFEKACSMGYADMSRVILLSDSYASALRPYPVSSTSSYSGGGGFSYSGGGGRASFGGGGGYSGGGRSGVR